jgi:hypothetical protein
MKHTKMSEVIKFVILKSTDLSKARYEFLYIEDGGVGGGGWLKEDDTQLQFSFMDEIRVHLNNCWDLKFYLDCLTFKNTLHKVQYTHNLQRGSNAVGPML